MIEDFKKGINSLKSTRAHNKEAYALMDMKTALLGQSNLNSSALVYGCMRIAGDQSTADREKGKTAIKAALEHGYNHFDHADIYGKSACESLFSEVLIENPSIRDEIILTSKCGIRIAGDPTNDSPQRYDFTKKWITASVENSLKRLNTDRLDLLLLHRPDFLMDPTEVAEAFSSLIDSGKVINVGVSNFAPSQVTMLQSFISQPLVVNQVEINIHNIDSILNGTLDQCIEQNMSPMAWCPIGGVAYPAWGNTFTPETETRIRAELDRQVEIYGVENWIVILAWLRLHPAGIFPIIGSTNPTRIKLAKKALELDYSREDWYRLLEARNGRPVA